MVYNSNIKSLCFEHWPPPGWLTEWLNLKVVGKSRGCFTQQVSQNEQPTHPFYILSSVSHRAGWGTKLEMPFRVTSFGSIQEEFFKSKKKTSWKNWLLVVLSLASWHHQSTSRVGELSNCGSMRDKRNSQTPEKWRAAPQHSWSLAAAIWGGGRKLNGVEEKETVFRKRNIN